MELNHIVKQLGVIPDLCVEEYIVNFFKSLDLQARSIMSIDPMAMTFSKLKVLNLSFNEVSRIENLPPNLEELYLNGNCVNEVAMNVNKPILSLVHLGLNRNQVRQPALTHIVKVFPNLVSLDVSFNDLQDMEATMTWCKKLKELKMLSLEGNPLILSPLYRKIVSEHMPNIKVLDSVTVPAEVRRDAELAAKEREKRHSQTCSESTTPIASCITLDLNLRLLKGVEGGRYLVPDENCEIETEKLDEIPVENKSSMYWVTYTNHKGDEVCTEKKAYIQHFQVEDNEAKPGS